MRKRLIAFALALILFVGFLLAGNYYKGIRTASPPGKSFPSPRSLRIQEKINTLAKNKSTSLQKTDQNLHRTHPVNPSELPEHQEHTNPSDLLSPPQETTTHDGQPSGSLTPPLETTSEKAHGTSAEKNTEKASSDNATENPDSSAVDPTPPPNEKHAHEDYISHLNAKIDETIHDPTLDEIRKKHIISHYISLRNRYESFGYTGDQAHLYSMSNFDFVSYSLEDVVLHLEQAGFSVKLETLNAPFSEAYRLVDFEDQVATVYTIDSRDHVSLYSEEPLELDLSNSSLIEHVEPMDVDPQNLTTDQIKVWVWHHYCENISNDLTEDDFNYEISEPKNGDIIIHLRQDTDPDCQSTSNPGPPVSPRVATYKIDANGLLWEKTTTTAKDQWKIIATFYDVW